MNLHDKILIALFVLICGCSFFGYKYFVLKNELERSDAYNEQLLQSAKESIRNQKKQHENAIKVLQSQSDSIVNLITVIEQRRKKDFINYQNKLNALTKVNTYNSRMQYLDSLQRAVGL